jgi:phosphoglycolate/pyridoxal phosphate phosphatase family enzyme
VPEALGKLRSSGQRLIFVTNAAGQSRASLAAKLTKLGVPGVTADDCVTSASAAAAYLATTHPQVKRAYVVGQGGLLDELRLKGIEPVGEKDVGGLEALIASGGLTGDVDAVVVGMQYEGLCYARLAKAAAYARDPQRPFVATNPDANFPAGLADMVPAGGCNVRFVAHAAEREPDVVVGKPSRDLALLLSSLYGLSPDTTLMVGDRINTDVAFGLSVGWRTMLVLSGCHSRADIRRANAAERPDYCADTVADLANLL